MQTAEIGMTENIGDSGFKFEVWFRRRRPHQSPQDTYVFQCSSKAIKVSWVDEIKNLLWKQALQNKGSLECTLVYIKDEYIVLKMFVLVEY